MNKKRFFISFNIDGLLRGDIKNRYQAYKTAIETGWLTRNEARQREGLNKLDGLDEPLQMLNMGSPGSDRDDDDDVEDGDDDDRK